MRYFNRFVIPVLFLLSATAFFSCKDYWEDRTEFKQYYSNETLLGKIESNPNLSKFVQYLKLTGFDQYVASAGSMTVFAPENSSFSGLDTTYVIADTVTVIKDSTKLANITTFVLNHVVINAITASDLKQLNKLKMESGKNLDVEFGTKIDGNDFISSDLFCNNGILHVLNGTLTPKKSIWQYLMTSPASETFRNTIKPYDVKVFYRSRMDSTTGLIARDSIYKSNILIKLADLTTEDSTYTYILLTDEAYQAERQKLITYFTAATNRATDSVLNWNIYKDCIVRGKVDINNPPAELTSIDGTTIPFNRNMIVGGYQASNGMVLVVNVNSIPVTNKIKPIIIDPDLFPYWAVSNDNSKYYVNNTTSMTSTFRGYVKYRNRPYALTGNDFLYSNYGGTKGVVMFPTDLYSNVKYKFYWTAVNDFQTTPIAQSMSLTGSVPTFFPSDSIRYTEFPTQQQFNNETYLGEGTTTYYGTYGLKVYSGFSTASSNSPIILNYIKIVPVLQ